MGNKLLIGTILAPIVGLAVGFYIGQSQTKTPDKSPLTTESQSSQTKNDEPATSDKGVISVERPAKGDEIGTPLLVVGSVKAKKGTVTIKLSQTGSGVGSLSDNIQFAEAIMFGLPAIPQEGILEVSFKDGSGQGLDDSVRIEIEFPSDLGR